MREEVAWFLFFEAQAHFRVISVGDQTASLHPCFQTGWVSNLFGAARRGHNVLS